MKVSFRLASENRKVGPIPTSMTEKKSCPDNCQWKENGCYARYGHVNVFWSRLSKLKSKLTWNSKERNILYWSEFLQKIKQLPGDQLWRYGVAGDLPGTNNNIDKRKLFSLIKANRMRRVICYSHKPVLGNSKQATKNRELIQYANSAGFTINLSADSLSVADDLYDLSISSVVTVLPSDAPNRLKTPKGRNVLVCPNQQNKYITCSVCQLCANPDRKTIIGFRAHGSGKKYINERLRIIQ